MNRRDFIRKTVYTGALFAGLGLRPLRADTDPEKWRKQSPNDKLNLGFIGTANQARFSIDNLKRLGDNFVAAADVDSRFLDKMKSDFPKIETCTDFRKLLERNDLDAVVVAVPDHIHAPAAAMALRNGLHVYCEKPLTHSVFEARTLIELSQKNKRVTQMGTQIHAEPNYRRVVELVQSGAIGSVNEVHVWCGKGWTDGRFVKDDKPCPPTLDWDLWLGPAPQHPYQSNIHPANWRKFWDFGGGTLADMGCHYTDLPFWALKLKHPDSCWAEGPPVHPDGTPQNLTIHWTFPARGELAAVKLHWYDGGARPQILSSPEIKGMKEKVRTKDGKELEQPVQWGSGVLFIGDKGMLLADYGRRKLLPEEKFKDFAPPPQSIAASKGHHAEWINAIKNNGYGAGSEGNTGANGTTCNFEYSGALSETILLGNVAFRTGQKLDWDAKELKATNCPAADAFIRREYRKGWVL
ncbi:MAG TPA: Gfo/Idh/MocA family oxidoreductase [Planctomycetota bacterium]|nr:Gfo/Idh/MocA family oxidoreductase [Planctomycetota bacterium]